MSIYSVIKIIAREKNVSIYRIEHDLNFANGTIGKWNVSNPSIANIQLVANYLGVTTDYILSEAVKSTNQLKGAR